MRLRKSLSVLVLVIGIIASFAPTASADPAVVFNRGNNDGFCSISGFGSYYVGSSTLVLNDNGGTIVCTAKLVSGPGAQEVVKGDGYISVFTRTTAHFSAKL